MISDRQLVMRAVLAGQIGSEHVTLQELLAVQQHAEELVLEANLELALHRGCTVFGGTSDKTVH